MSTAIAAKPWRCASGIAVQEPVGGSTGSLGDDLKDAAADHIVQYRDVVVPFAEALLVEPEIGQLLQRAPIQPAGHRARHDPIHPIPRQLGQPLRLERRAPQVTLLSVS